MILQRFGYILVVLCMMAPLFGPFSELFSAMMIGVLVTAGIYSGQYRRRLDPVKLLGIIFIGYFAVLFLAGVMSSASLWQTLESLAPASPVLILGLAAFFSDPKWLKVDPRDIGFIATLSILVMYFTALLLWQFQIDFKVLGKGILHHSQVNGRLRLFAGNPLPFGAIMVTLCGLSMACWGQKPLAAKILSLSALCIGVGIVALWTEARGAFLTSGLLFIPIGIGAWRYFRETPPSPRIYFAFAMMALIGAFYIWPAENSAFARLFMGLNTLKTGQSFDHSTYLRLVMYGAALEAFSDSWLLGYGPYARFSAIEIYIPPEMSFRFTHLHNVFLNHAVAAGVPGVYAAFAVLIAPLALAWKYAADRRGSTLFLTSILTLSMFGCGMSNVLLFHDLTAYFFATLSVIAVSTICLTDDSLKQG